MPSGAADGIPQEAVDIMGAYAELHDMEGNERDADEVSADFRHQLVISYDRAIKGLREQALKIEADASVRRRT